MYCCDERARLHKLGDCRIFLERVGEPTFILYDDHKRVVALITFCPWCGKRLEAATGVGSGHPSRA